MNFNFTDEQQLLVDSVRRFVRENYSFEARREVLRSESGWSRPVWDELAALGLTALNVPEEHGGLGATPVETMLVMNALGEGLLLEPFLASAVLAPALLTRCEESETVRRLLPAIATGERIVVVAHQEPQSRGELEHVVSRAEKIDTGYVIDGYKAVIAHAPAADEFLVTARLSGQAADPNGIGVFRVAINAPGVTVKRFRTMDGQPTADIALERVRVSADDLIASGPQAFSAIEGAHHVALSALCAEAVGIMKATLTTTIEYTRSRKQFGQPIAKFQVLQHRMADMFIQSEQAMSMSYLAAIRCVDPDLTERRRALAAAKVVIGQAGRFIAQEAVQLHGGMGMTDEMLVSHYFKRLTAIDLTLGDADHHLAKFAALSAA
jgi:alkylation response protein AidB-like acyl-CoA dehydrogenase